MDRTRSYKSIQLKAKGFSSLEVCQLKPNQLIESVTRRAKTAHFENANSLALLTRSSLGTIEKTTAPAAETPGIELA
jgi:hypothetical protein